MRLSLGDRLSLLRLFSHALLRRNEGLFSLALSFFLLLLLFLQPLVFLRPFFGLFRKEIFAAFNLEIDLALFLWRREGRVHLVGLFCDLEWCAPLTQCLFLELWKEPIPTFILQGWIFGQLSFDHEFFHMVYGMYVVHTVFNHSSHLFQSFVAAHGADSVALYQDVSVGEEFQCLQGRAVRAQQTLAPFDKSFFVSDKVSNLDDIAGIVVLEDFDSLKI